MTAADAHEAVRLERGNVDRAAHKLGLSKATVYRRLRQRVEPGPRMGGRIVR